MTEELKACPFCGSKKIVKAKESSGHGEVSTGYKCFDCSASLIKYFGAAAKEWNTRPLEDERDKRIEELEEKLGKVTGRNAC